MWRCRGAQRKQTQGNHGSAYQQVDPDLHQRPDHAQATQPQEDNMSEKVMEYLTMARIMENELEKFKVYKTDGWRTLTGMERVLVEGAYKAGFMAGFAYRFTGEQND
jgi:hypothetical protein